MRNDVSITRLIEGFILSSIRLASHNGFKASNLKYNLDIIKIKQKHATKIFPIGILRLEIDKLFQLVLSLARHNFVRIFLSNRGRRIRDQSPRAISSILSLYGSRTLAKYKLWVLLFQGIGSSILSYKILKIKLIYHQDENSDFDEITRGIPACKNNPSFCPISALAEVAKDMKPPEPMEKVNLDFFFRNINKFQYCFTDLPVSLSTSILSVSTIIYLIFLGFFLE